MEKTVCIVFLTAVFATSAGVSAQEREIRVRNDRKVVEADGFWIYNDLPKALAEAKTTGKPLLVVIRCIPCEACAQLDAQVVNRDPVVQKLLNEFVCLRLVHANGLDLSLFQYDYDQSFAAFFLNADKTVYGRYGTRSHQRESERDVSVEGFARALEGALALHRQYPANAKVFAAKRGRDSAVKAPEEFASLKGKYGPRLDYAGNVVRSCIHCHQVGEAQRLEYRLKNEPIPEQLMYPYPLPNVLGLTMDPSEKARVREVAAESSAAKDGVKAGDDIIALEGQPLLSIADIQWVLHNAGSSGRLKAEVRRGDKMMQVPLTLEPGWRRRGDISWRASSWDLRRMATGGLLFESLPPEDREKAGLPAGTLALRIKHVGQYGPHAAAKNAGFLKGDVLVELDGKKDPLTESQLMTALIDAKRPGDRVTAVVLRDGNRITLNLPIQ